jgi:hypothetical protein
MERRCAEVDAGHDRIEIAELEIRGKRGARKSTVSVCIMIEELKIRGPRGFGRYAVS